MVVKPNKNSNSFRLIKTLAEVKDWRIEVLDPFSGSLIRVTDAEGRSTLVGTGRHSAYPINSATASGIAKDKAHTAQVLSAAGLSTPRTELVFLEQRWQAVRPTGRERADAPKLAARLGYPLIVKPNEGANGVHVFCVEDDENLHAALEVIATQAPTAVLQRPLQGEESRLFILEGRPLYTHKKRAIAPCLAEATSLDAFVDAECKRRRDAGMPEVSAYEKALFERQLHAAGVTDLATIPAGTPLAFGFANNLAQAGQVLDLRTSFSTPEKDLAHALYKAFGLEVMGVDMMCSPDQLDKATVLEVNANPGIKALNTFEREDIALHIFETVIAKSLK